VRPNTGIEVVRFFASPRNSSSISKMFVFAFAHCSRKALEINRIDQPSLKLRTIADSARHSTSMTKQPVRRSRLTGGSGAVRAHRGVPQRLLGDGSVHAENANNDAVMILGAFRHQTRCAAIGRNLNV